MNNYYSDEWILKVQNILNECGLYEYWTNPDKLKEISYVNFKKLYKGKLANMYKNKWVSQLQESSKCSLYRNFKDGLTFEKYLVTLPVNLRQSLIRFRTSNHKLPIETGRYLNILRENRLCTLCLANDIGDEYHYMFICEFFKDVRERFVLANFVSY